jgi:tRNA G46 methylase TrmB
MKNLLTVKGKSFRVLVRELKATLAKRGIAGTVVFIFNKLKSDKKEYSVNYSDDDFDKRYNVETARIIKTGELETKSKNWKYAVRYEPTDSKYSFTQILSSFGIHYPDYTFIDMGSGKGRVLMLASMLPFKKIIGVEFSESLIETAKTNLTRFPEDLQLCKNIELLSMDASEYSFPDPAEKFVLFMNNPFHKIIMEKVMENLTKSFHANPRRIILIYINPRYSSVLESLSFMKKHEYREDPNSDLYDVKPEYLTENPKPSKKQ